MGLRRTRLRALNHEASVEIERSKGRRGYKRTAGRVLGRKGLEPQLVSIKGGECAVVFLTGQNQNWLPASRVKANR
jgi:hypothetical protein